MKFRPGRLRRLSRRLLASFVVILCVGLTLSWIVAGRLVAPSPRLVGEPPTQLNAETITLASQSGSQIAGWYVPSREDRGVVVLLHGIRSSRLAMLDRAKMLKQQGFAIVMIDFQAHGESPGDHITIGYQERHDVRAAVEFARSRQPELPIGVIGISMGGAAALLSSPLDVDAVVLESVYPDIQDAVDNRVSRFLGPLSWLPSKLLLIQLEPRLGIKTSQLRPIDHIAKIGCPVLIMSGKDDEHTTTEESEAMYAAAQHPKRIWLVDDTGHEDLHSACSHAYEQELMDFFDRWLPAR